jgi:erythritol transport system permease protein
VPISVLVLAVCAIIAWAVLSRSAFGRWLYASGGNERAAELSGVPVKRVKITVYTLSGALRGDCGPCPVLAADLGRPDRGHHL